MLKKIVYIIIAVLILVASTGFSLNMHYCHDALIDVAFIAPAENCCSVDDVSSCCDINQVTRKSHCEDRHLAVETDDYISSNLTFDFQNVPQVDLPWFTFPKTIISISTQKTLSSLPDFSKPPPLPDVLLSEIQAFLL